MTEVRSQSQKDALIGFQFLATIISRCHGCDVNFMPDSAISKPSLDSAEPWFKAMAELHKAKEMGE